MYARIFQSIYDGTLVEDWRALVTFQQMLVLCDADGVVDMTPRAISRRTGIPIEHIEAGIRVLESPDPTSRTPNEDGRRILRIDPHRDWGWRLVNHQKYKDIRTEEDRREYMRRYMAERRKDVKLTVVNTELTVNSRKQELAKLAHIDVDVDLEEETNTRAPSAFEVFWQAYPKKKSKGQAERAWRKINPSKQLQDRILNAVEQAKTSVEWKKDDGQFIPYPASWLNARGWEDEAPAPPAQKAKEFPR